MAHHVMMYIVLPDQLIYYLVIYLWHQNTYIFPLLACIGACRHLNPRFTSSPSSKDARRATACPGQSILAGCVLCIDVVHFTHVHARHKNPSDAISTNNIFRAQAHRIVPSISLQPRLSPSSCLFRIHAHIRPPLHQSSHPHPPHGVHRNSRYHP